MRAGHVRDRLTPPTRSRSSVLSRAGRWPAIRVGYSRGHDCCRSHGTFRCAGSETITVAAGGAAFLLPAHPVRDSDELLLAGERLTHGEQQKSGSSTALVEEGDCRGRRSNLPAPSRERTAGPHRPKRSHGAATD